MFRGCKKLPIDNCGNAERCIGVDDHKVLGVKVAWTKWETSIIEGGVIQRRNQEAQEPSVAILEYLVAVAKRVRISQPIINITRESLR